MNDQFLEIEYLLLEFKRVCLSIKMSLDLGHSKGDTLTAEDYQTAKELDELLADEKKRRQREYARRYYAEHKEACLTRRKAYYKANQQRVRTQQKDYYEAHKAERLAKAHAYQKSHKAKITEKRHAYYLAHKAEISEKAHAYYQKKK